jgi:hypothetical protein
VSQPYDYFKSFFRLDHTGKPERKFHIRVAEGPAQEIVSPKHSLDVLDHLRRIDARMSELIDTFGQRLARDTHSAYDELLRLHAHAAELFAQAIYLDTADRNNWEKIRMVYVPGGEPTTFSSRYDDLKRFWNGKLEREHKAESAPGF